MLGELGLVVTQPSIHTLGAFAAGGTRLRIDHVFDAVQVR